MVFLLNSLANLPVDDEVHFYIFVINGQWQEPLYDLMEQNFARVARSIGDHAVIAKGLDPQAFYGEIEERYFGNDADMLFSCPCERRKSGSAAGHNSSRSSAILSNSEVMSS